MMYLEKIRILRYILPALLFLGSCQNKPLNEGLSEKPNIVIVIADDLGWADVGYNGAEFYETPNIDKLAADGMVFNRFYPGAANCAPSRACLMTGMFTPRHSVYLPQGLARGGDVSKMRWKVPTQGQDSSFNTFHVSINNVDPGFESLAEVLKRSGYISARLGKWHIGDDNQGFDEVSAAGVMGEITNYNGSEKRYYDDTLVAEKLTDAALDFIEENRDKPFFLYLAHWEVHGPLVARKQRIKYYQDKLNSSGITDLNPVYAAEVEQVDISLGRVIHKLKDLNLEKNTIVIFTSDNGGVTGNTSNLPLRAGKGTFYEGGIRVPFCIRWPGVINPGSQTDVPVNGVDFMPTFAKIASAQLPVGQPVDGVSFLHLLRGEQLERENSYFFHFPLYLGGSRDAVLPTWDGQENYWRAVPSTTIISGDWKLIHYYEYDRYELFNLKDDISEQHDLSSTKPEIGKKLLEELQAWTDDVSAPVPVIPNE